MSVAQLEIIKLNINDVKPYKKNAKLHTKKQIEQIISSIKEFGMNDPIGIWGDKNIIVEGHGRYEALKQLGVKEIECIRLDHLNDEQRRAYTLAHNKLTMNTDFDFDILDDELDNIIDIDMSDFGFELEDDELGISENEKAEIEFTELLGEENNYIVLKFNNDVDWLQLQSIFDLKTRKAYSTRKDGETTEKMVRAGVGRVVDGTEFLNRVGVDF